MTDQMTIGELCGEWLGWDHPDEVLIFVIDLLRTVTQGECATLDGVTASVIAWKKLHGKITEVKVRKWVTECLDGELVKQPVPFSLLAKMIEAQSKETI